MLIISLHILPPLYYSAFGILHLYSFLFLYLSCPNQTGEIWKRQLTFVFEQGRRAGSTSRPRARENRVGTISRLSRRHLHTKSVKSVCSSRFSRASQSPYTVEKQPKSTPDIYTQPHPSGVEVDHTYPRDIHCCRHDCVQTLRRF
jgi:hypothetical protein